MAALNFPLNPSDGQTFTTNSGIIYTWSESDSVWTSGQVADLPLSGGTLTGPLTLGGDPDNGGSVGIKIKTNGCLQATIATASSANAIWEGHKQGTSAPTSTINGNGAATFAGTVSAQGSVLTSDKRFKKNVTDAKAQLADVVALGNSLKNWDWTDDAPVLEKDVRSLGLIAQDVEEICPSLVVTQERTDDSYKGIKNDARAVILGSKHMKSFNVESSIFDLWSEGLTAPFRPCGGSFVPSRALPQKRKEL